MFALAAFLLFLTWWPRQALGLIA